MAVKGGKGTQKTGRVRDRQEGGEKHDKVKTISLERENQRGRNE